jgi:hypothetical protein
MFTKILRKIVRKLDKVDNKYVFTHRPTPFTILVNKIINAVDSMVFSFVRYGR